MSTWPLRKCIGPCDRVLPLDRFSPTHNGYRRRTCNQCRYILEKGREAKARQREAKQCQQ